ncbi:hypothetical protein OIY81_1658 [Cryptosporidium canis]|uniref:THUMP domain-containing protein n=1 Tax=Cryptosporidium canis TaxID=195482 RepID=A0ABQ8P5B6_9CRYT|nr:hypothetical protein OJ252_3437 [Cryptosporidium canis]KAJ1611599.1 hypothetical protein OIY81_1658 [Cryptosporidium canis]
MVVEEEEFGVGETRQSGGCGPASSADSDEIAAISSFISSRKRGAGSGESGYLPDQLPKKGKVSETGSDVTSGTGSSRRRARDSFTCIVCVVLRFQDVFTRRNSMVRIGELNYNELYMRCALKLLLRTYKDRYYEPGVTPERPEIYPTFDFPVAGDPKDSPGSDSQEPSCRVARVDPHSEFSLILGDGQSSDKRVGLHLSLTRNHQLTKSLSLAFLTSLVRKLGNCQLRYEAPEGPSVPQQVELKAGLRPFPVYLDYDSIVILENAGLHSRRPHVNGGLFAAILVHDACKAAHLDPIIETIDQACLDIGIPPLYSERIAHVSLFYIKKSSLSLKHTRQHENTDSNHILRTSSLQKEFLESKEGSQSSLDLINPTGVHAIWVDKLVFRVGIYEYHLLLGG